jgi:integrase
MKGTIRFLARKERLNNNHTIPIELIYSLHGSKATSSLDLSVPVYNWHFHTDPVTGKQKNMQEALFVTEREASRLGVPKWVHLFSKTEVDRINSELLSHRVLIADIERMLESKCIETGGSFSSEDVISMFKAKLGFKSTTSKGEPTNLVFDFIDQYILENSATRVPGSLQVYKSLRSHLMNFERSKGKRIKFADMDYSFFQSFQNFLITNTTTKRFSDRKNGYVGGKTLNNTTIAKQLSTLKTFLGYAKRYGVKIPDGYKDFIIKRQSLEVIALTESEFNQIRSLDLTHRPALDRARDVFVFSCMVGWRYSDLAQLRREHIRGDEVYLYVQKTKQQLVTPLNAIAYEILQKYSKAPHPLPIISNQKYNEHIQEICKLAEINEPIEIVRFRGAERVSTIQPKYELISAHTGRKSFASMLLAKGIAAQVIMELGGWTSFKSFQRYIKVNENTKRNAVVNAWGAPKTLKKVSGGVE